MFAKLTPTHRLGLALGLAALAYFVTFPNDLSALLAPFQSVLELTGSVATGAYVLLGLLIVAWVVVRVWGRRPIVEARPIDHGPAA